ncbi:MAG: PASTA domain-containing protein, partial [Muribaculaceae bacterium]|nr:PASTA domain-containing protein [Muribaculaceae bacterium]
YHLGGGVVFGGGSPIVDTHSPADLPVRRFLEYSSNIGMTKLVAPHYRDYPNGLRDRIKEMGLFEPFKTGIAGEVPPYFPNLSVKDGGLVTLGRQTWGYGNQISPLYLCAFYNAIANDGKFVRPRLVSKITTERGDSIIPVSYIREKVCSERTARDVRDMLRQVVVGQGGTAKNMKTAAVNVAGKTGTAKIAKELSEADREKLRKNPKDSTVHRPKGYMDRVYRFSFCGFFPYENPKYTCIVVISHPRTGGSNNAGIVSGTVMLNTVNRMYSRGMLGTGPDFRKTASSVPSSMTIQATRQANRDGLVRQFAGTGGHGHRLVTPGETRPGTAPNVVGLSLREAIVAIEERGYELKYSGTGAVVSQTPPPGQPLRKGETIELTLSTRL